jgi:NAD(P) transhydrogenase
MEQGRLAAHHTAGRPAQLARTGSSRSPANSLPEFCFIGKTEDRLTRDCVPFEAGASRCRKPGRIE